MIPRPTLSAEIEAQLSDIVAEFSTAKLIILYGSQVSMLTHANSDVDILIVDDSMDAAFRELRCEAGKKVDLLCYSSVRLRNSFVLSALANDTVMISAIERSILIAGTAEDYADLIDFAREQNAKCAAAELLSERIYLQGIIEDFTACQSLEEYLVLSAKLFDAIVGVAMVAAGKGGFTKISAARELKRLDSTLLAELCQSLVNLGKADFQSIQAVAGKVLNSIGGPVHGRIRLGIR